MGLGNKRRAQVVATVASPDESRRAKLRRRGAPLLLAFSIWLCWAVTTYFLLRWSDDLGPLLAFLLLGGVTLLGLVGLLFQIRRDHWRQRKQDIDQTQSALSYMQELIWLSGRISHRHPLPYPLYRTGYEASLGLLNVAWEFIAQERPRRVLELGSGLSSVVMAYALEANGTGELLSLENSDEYATISRRMLDERGLSERARILDAPLVPVQIDGESHLWYSLPDLRSEGPIDFLFVDGPAEDSAHMARYPAMPMLRRFLADNAIIILDDTHREQEQRIVQRWLERFPEVSVIDSDRFRNYGFTVLRLAPIRADSA